MGFKSSRQMPDLESTLNREGSEGWCLCEVIQLTTVFGETTAVIIVLERVLDQ